MYDVSVHGVDERMINVHSGVDERMINVHSSSSSSCYYYYIPRALSTGICVSRCLWRGGG